MSKIFYDNLIILEKVEVVIRGLPMDKKEKEKIWKLVDEIIHHRVLFCILDKLPKEHHHDFLTKFHEAPHDERLLSYLNELVEGNIEESIVKEVENLEKEILREIQGD